MGLHISKAEAKNEALRIASEFLAVQFADEKRWRWECCEPTPDTLSSNFKTRRTVVKWGVVVRLIPKEGSSIDGSPVVLVDILSKEARFIDGL